MSTIFREMLHTRFVWVTVFSSPSATLILWRVDKIAKDFLKSSFFCSPSFEQNHVYKSLSHSSTQEHFGPLLYVGFFMALVI